nr:MAG TPA: hypothetical protein [Caudoviricetes sp.]
MPLARAAKYGVRQHRQPTTGGKPLLNPRGLND